MFLVVSRGRNQILAVFSLEMTTCAVEWQKVGYGKTGVCGGGLNDMVERGVCIRAEGLERRMDTAVLATYFGLRVSHIYT